MNTDFSGSLLDSTVFIAAAFRRERHHEEGREIVSSVEEGLLGKAVVTDYIVDEVVAFVRKRKSAIASIEVPDAMLYSRNLDVVKVEGRHFEAGMQLFRTYEGLSFTDCTSFNVMERYGVTHAFTFDRHFRDAGFKTIP